ncbi:amino acid ABC transporter substrate-binding protein [Haloimpatiens lingqiaonensis]|uniref:amino acid ABC transporter substrate-binding protein n=1 Tax=Haloimpatiens lingqiaonensis TaxID=1380675 RepID=UPI0010FF5BAD|nr:amino acid ABC transporter substrate-binding protein [Haloimpatiens lingqiaonensis]
MKKVVVALVAVLLISALAGCGVKVSHENSKGSYNDKLVIGLDDSFPPMGFRDENGEVVGFDIDLAKEVGKRIGLAVEFKPVDWDGILLSLNNRDIDLIWNGLTITNERKEKIGFSKAYLKNRQIIVVTKDSNIAGKNDLKGKIVGVQMGSSSDEALSKDSALVNELKGTKKYSNNTEALMDLKIDRVNAVVVDEVVARYYMTKKPGVYKILEDNFGEEEYGVGYRKNDTELGEKIDKALEEIKKDGTMDKVYKKWFGEK